jgi:hypothetical protein
VLSLFLLAYCLALSPIAIGRPAVPGCAREILLIVRLPESRMGCAAPRAFE